MNDFEKHLEPNRKDFESAPFGYKAILRLLTHFFYWAGRYPDPGSGKESKAEEIFTLSEKYKISAKDLFTLSSKIMRHSQNITSEL